MDTGGLLVVLVAHVLATLLSLVALGDASVELGEQSRHLQGAGVAGTVDTAAVVDDILGQTGSLEGIADEVAGQDIAAGEAESDLRSPVDLLVAAGPEATQEPDQGLVVVVLAEDADQNVQVVKADLGKVDLQLANDVENFLDNDCRNIVKLLLSRSIGLRGDGATSDENTKSEHELDNGSTLEGIVGRDVVECTQSQVAGVIILLSLQKFKNANIAGNTNRSNDVRRLVGAEVVQDSREENLDLVGVGQLCALSFSSHEVGRELGVDARSCLQTVASKKEVVQTRSRDSHRVE